MNPLKKSNLAHLLEFLISVFILMELLKFLNKLNIQLKCMKQFLVKVLANFLNNVLFEFQRSWQD